MDLLEAIEKSDFTKIAIGLRDEMQLLITKSDLVTAIEVGNLGILSLLLQYQNVEINETFQEICADAELDIVTTFLDSPKLIIKFEAISEILQKGRIDLAEVLLKNYRFKDIEFPENWLCNASCHEELFKMIWKDKRFSEARTSYLILNQLIMTDAIDLIEYILEDQNVVDNISKISPFIVCLEAGTPEIFRLLTKYKKPAFEVMKHCLLKGKEAYLEVALEIAEMIEIKSLLFSSFKRIRYDSITKIIDYCNIKPDVHLLNMAIDSGNDEVVKHIYQHYQVLICDGITCAPRYALLKGRDNISHWLLENLRNCGHFVECLKISIVKRQKQTASFLIPKFNALPSDLTISVLGITDMEFLDLALTKVEKVDHVKILNMIGKPKKAQLLNIICKRTKVDLLWQGCILVKTAVVKKDENALMSLLNSKTI